MDGSSDRKPVEAEVRPRTAGDSPKSRRTRARILNEALRLFAEVGYHPATNAVIADAAELTRGAMLYHFASRAALLDAVIPHIQAERARLFEAAARDVAPLVDRTDHAIDSYWRLLHEPAFVAFAELETAARTDSGLQERLRPAQEAFDRAQASEHMFNLVQAGDSPRFQTSRDIARFLLEGLSHGHLAYDEAHRTERLLAVIKRVVRQLNHKGPASDLWVG